jgi:hypothetical protein
MTDLPHRSTRIFAGRCACLPQTKTGRKCFVNLPRFVEVAPKGHSERKRASRQLHQPVNQPDKETYLHRHAALTVGYVGKPFLPAKQSHYNFENQMLG